MLHKAIEICQQFETSKKQVLIVRGQEEDLSVTEIHEVKQKPLIPGRSTPTSCFRCGGDSQHPRTKGKCPVQVPSCSFCKKQTTGPKSVAHVKRSTASPQANKTRKKKLWLPIYTPNTTLSNQQEDNKWVQELPALGKHIFKINTGARCNTITQWLTTRQLQTYTLCEPLKESFKLSPTITSTQRVQLTLS